MARPQWLSYFDELPEPRVERTRLHSMSDIILMMLVGAICDCHGWDAVVEFFEDAPPELLEMFEFAHGVPSADTVRRVMGALSPERFEKAFLEWTQSLAGLSNGRLIAIDGKTVRGAVRKNEHSRALHLVNAWMDDNSLALGQVATSLKSNEITAIPELLKLLDLRGAVVSADAMGCQHEIVNMIIERGGDYVLGLKRNQPALHQEAMSAFSAKARRKIQETEGAYHEESDKAHGRIELRRTWVLSELSDLASTKQWTGLSALVLVEATRTIGNETSTEQRLYISSCNASAQTLGSLVRRHWSIENKLHWVLDVTFREDHARIRGRNSAQNLALLRKLALNLLHGAPHGSRQLSIVAKKRRATRNVAYLMSVLVAGNTAIQEI